MRKSAPVIQRPREDMRNSARSPTSSGVPARLAGMPQDIVRRAETILHQLESSADREGLGTGAKIGNLPDESHMQLSFFQLDDPVLCQIRDQILGLDINALTPIEALNKLDGIKRILTGK